MSFNFRIHVRQKKGARERRCSHLAIEIEGLVSQGPLFASCGSYDVPLRFMINLANRVDYVIQRGVNVNYIHKAKCLQDTGTQ